MSESTKDTLYVEAENDITEIISKVIDSKAKIIALVVPKRSSTLQSIINLKLLKRSAKNAKKNLVLVTSDSGIMLLAGASGMYVAKSPTSKPFIPESSNVEFAPEEVESVAAVQSSESIESVPFGSALPRIDSTQASSESVAPEENEPIIIKSADVPGPEEVDETVNDTNKTKKTNNKKLKVPNFNKFRVKLFAGIGVILLLAVGYLFAFIILPKAQVVITTDTSNIEVSLNVTGSVSATKLDTDKLLIPAVKKELSKSETETASATGERDEGTRASGDVTLSIACSDVSGTPPTVPAGTGVSAGGITYITQASTSLTTPSFNDGCSFIGNTKATARENGDQYNQPAKNYTVAGFPLVTGFGGAMTGGSSKKVKFITQSDIDGARQKVLDKLKSNAQTELESQFSEDTVLLKDSFLESEPTVTSNPAVDSPADTVVVVVKLTYSELAVKKTDLSSLLDAEVKRKIDTNQQMIQDNGSSNSKIRITSALDAAGILKFQLTTLAVSGPQIEVASIKSQIAGKSKTEANDILKSRQGVKNVEIQFSPFWVSSFPGSSDKIDIRFEKSK
ncbi:hypothetical protein KA068_00600 [Candidatus Saccharibacteria bacterium]|jgi:hypothetical protein|nr:hypothetical protein [Candidatus Saccharibacteria bacterium]